jgi:hypothetical protein
MLHSKEGHISYADILGDQEEEDDDDGDDDGFIIFIDYKLKNTY